MRKLKILFIAPHLSTGGMPAFLLKRIQALQEYNKHEISVVEYQCYGLDYVVQRNQIKNLVQPVYTLEEDKMNLFDVVNSFNPDIIHIDEMSERLSTDVIDRLYSNDRKYRIVETCHDISFNPLDKIHTPDAYAFCSPYHLDTFAEVEGYKSVIEFPIDLREDYSKEDFKKKLGFDTKRKQIVNVGLWTPGKNQVEGIEFARKLPEADFHFIGNQAENFKEFWMPLMEDLPSNVYVHGEKANISDYIKASDIFMFNSTWECNPIVLREAIGYGKLIVARNLPQYKNMFSKYIGNYDNKEDLYKRLSELIANSNQAYGIPRDNTTKDFAKKHTKLYKKIMKRETTKSKRGEPLYKITQHFVGQPFLEITGTSKDSFYVEFSDADNFGKLIHTDTIKVGHWIKLNTQYYKNIRVTVDKLPISEKILNGTGGLYANRYKVYDNTLDYTNRRIYIAIDSPSLGDNIAWIPYVEEFRKKHNCKVIVSTYKNFLFQDVYPELEFVEPGTIVNNIYGMYTIGWFYDSNKEPILPNTIPLQQAASNILGLEYKEIKPNIKYNKLNVARDYITIATNSTAGCKFWTRENWQEVINYLVTLGYDVINTSLEDNPFENCIVLDDKSLLNTIDVIANSKFFIGLSSGLSWLAWSLDKEVIMISNFTNEEHEFKCHRPIVKSVCNSCWNNQNFKFDKGDWNWCPINKGTDKQFECQTAITPKLVIDEINKLK